MSFLQENSTFILSVLALVGGGGTAIISYLLRSRCTKVTCCFGACGLERDVPPVPPVANSV